MKMQVVTGENEASVFAKIDALSGSQVKIPVAGDRVYKDECVFSFDTPESETGLYISLNSFLGVGQDHLEAYHKRTSDSLFLHYRRIKVKVPRPQEGPEKKVTRLAIGVDGGFDGGRDFDYEITEFFQLAVLPELHVIPLPNSKLSEKVVASVAAIQAAESASRLAELEALAGTWDGEIRVVSKYAENLLQLDNGKKIPPKGWRCEAEGCTLTENLWLNLTDGSILCGRRFFDGSGGNNHAIDHYNKCKYPLAVKLGTITPAGRGDVYSYDEDDMVEDPKLAEHLAKFGINVAVLEKTDKSMIEMEIELNQRHSEWNDIQEAGSKLQPLFGPGFTGLINLGNTCYLNSVMQVLFSIPAFQKRYTENACKYFEGSRDPVNDFNVQMSKLSLGLLSGKYSVKGNEEQPGISPQMFRNLIGRGHPEFSTKKQQDAQEFYLHLINTIERHSVREPNPSDCLKFEVEDKLICDLTGMVRYIHRTEYCVPLPILPEAAMNKAEVAAYEAKKLAAEAEGRRLPPEELVRPRLSFDTCLQALAAEEKVDLRTTGAQTDGTATKFTRLKTFPDYLVFQLKKFTVGQDWTPKKLDVSVDIPHSLDISFLRAQGLQPNEVLLPEESQTKKAPAVDDTVVQHIMEMGFHANAARKAVIHTGNCGSEAATNWIMQHLDDTDLNDPISDDVCGADATFIADQDAVENIQLMGFTAEQAAKALRATDNNIERAVDWIFSHQDELNSSTSPASNANNLPQNKYTDGSGKYDLMGFISHMGSSSMVGHYVCHILKDGKWAIFNDNKVALSENLPKDLGYLYFYKRSTL